MSPEQRTFEDLERLRRSIAMLASGQPALERDQALALLTEMQQVRRNLDRVERALRHLVAGMEDG